MNLAWRRVGPLNRYIVTSEGFDFLGAQFFDQIGGLLERHVAIVVAMDQQHRGAPVRDAARFEFIKRKSFHDPP